MHGAAIAARRAVGNLAHKRITIARYVGFTSGVGGEVAIGALLLAKGNMEIERDVGCAHLGFILFRGISRLRARPKGFPVALWKPSGTSTSSVKNKQGKPAIHKSV
jgi:hypothetical protein